MPQPKPHGNADVPCRCGHAKSKHHHGKDCLQVVDEKHGKYCPCYLYRPVEEKVRVG